MEDFKLQRLDASYKNWRDARQAERFGDFKKARTLYLNAVECFEQFEKLENIPELTAILNQLRTEYEMFVLDRDPEYRAILKFVLPIVQKFDGILQTEIYKWENSNFKRPDFTYALYFAEKEGLVQREKKGRSYQVHFVKDKSNDTLNVIQDDEAAKQLAAQQRENMRGCGRLATNFVLICVCISLFPLMGPFALLPSAVLVAFFVIRSKREKRILSKPTLLHDFLCKGTNKILPFFVFSFLLRTFGLGKDASSVCKVPKTCLFMAFFPIKTAKNGI